MRQLGAIAAILVGLALVAWSVLAISGADISWLALRSTPAGRDRSEAVLPGLIGIALVGYAGWSLLLGRERRPSSNVASDGSPPEA